MRHKSFLFSMIVIVLFVTSYSKASETKISSSEKKYLAVKTKIPSSEAKIPSSETKISSSETKISSSEKKLPSSETKISGSYHWFNGITVILRKDGTVINNRGGNGVWFYNKETCEYIITWKKDNWKDYLNLSENGKWLIGRNQGGKIVWGEK